VFVPESPSEQLAPFGLLRRRQVPAVRVLGYEPVVGDVYPGDVACREPEVIIERVMARLTADLILILHDSRVLGDCGRSETVNAAETIPRLTSDRGLAATSVWELMHAMRGGARKRSGARPTVPG
jgi:hypothetical protein